jgi:hypothetical protein
MLLLINDPIDNVNGTVMSDLIKMQSASQGSLLGYFLSERAKTYNALPLAGLWPESAIRFPHQSVLRGLMASEIGAAGDGAYTQPAALKLK